MYVKTTSRGAFEFPQATQGILLANRGDPRLLADLDSGTNGLHVFSALLPGLLVRYMTGASGGGGYGGGGGEGRTLLYTCNPTSGG